MFGNEEIRENETVRIIGANCKNTYGTIGHVTDTSPHYVIVYLPTLNIKMKLSRRSVERVSPVNCYSTNPYSSNNQRRKVVVSIVEFHDDTMTIDTMPNGEQLDVIYTFVCDNDFNDICTEIEDVIDVADYEVGSLYAVIENRFYPIKFIVTLAEFV